jgi:hypothetical protein
MASHNEAELPFRGEYFVLQPPYNNRYMHALRWRGSIVKAVIPSVVTLVLWATLITLLHK